MFDMTRMRRRVGGIFVCAAAAVAAALGGHLLLLGTFPTAWFATDRNPEMPSKEAISMDQLDPEQIAGLLKRGGELIAAGDVSLARLVLKRAYPSSRLCASAELNPWPSGTGTLPLDVGSN